MRYGKFSKGWGGSRQVYSVVYVETETSAGVCWSWGAQGQKCVHKSVLLQRNPHGFGHHISSKIRSEEVRREQEQA